MNRTAPSSLALLGLVACQLNTARDISGNFEVNYPDTTRVYINDSLVAEVGPGEDADIEWNGESFTISALCSDEGVECPSETFWGAVAFDQPWGSEYTLVNAINLDQDLGTPGQRLGGLLADDGSFNLLSGLALGANENCAVLGVGVVHGQFNDDASAIEDGTVSYAWGAGCEIDGVQINASLRIESDFTATRTGDLDLSSVTPEAPIDEEGEAVDPEEPEDAYLDEASAGL